jgi:hypothetical protein
LILSAVIERSRATINSATAESLLYLLYRPSSLRLIFILFFHMAQFLFHKIILGFYFIWRRRRRRNTFQWNWNGDGRGAQRDQRVVVGCAVLYRGMPRELLLRVIMISSDTAYRPASLFRLDILLHIRYVPFFQSKRSL